MKTREEVKAMIDELLDQRNEHVPNGLGSDAVTRIDLQLDVLREVLYG